MKKPGTLEGLEQSEWILMDYVDTVIHVFGNEFKIFLRFRKSLERWKNNKN
jgi:ribosomal silencing factor RsfS